ncbi:hypothetical protein HYH03_009358 [Edaphochlamys debaryana]|uniref:DUF1995 domain-containing protein n=1 Tax=Edaphochlamys debaryana TaxID=47281 RepID=A0A836BXD3_9CHLO|nr:hypothetical protein HYH03_009358 [Edaphochlamys debaryana]|eukprot:KAG2492415.1 hypothetical protein HYH03_009358 [Edaphochlamys debaryana]
MLQTRQAGSGVRGCARRPAGGRRLVVSARASTSESAEVRAQTNRIVPLPEGPAQQVQQAVQAIEAAWRDGVKRQRLELLLPLIGATDLDDWPGGIRQQFKAAQPMVESILRSVKQIEGLQGPLAANIWDQGDAVGAWTGKELACVLFPTAATLDKLTKLCNGPDAPGLVIIVNPQWETRGNLMSDFGFGQRKVDAERFIEGFEYSYCLKQLRVYGDTIRTLKAHPNRWQVHVAGRKVAPDCIATRDEQPTYQEIEALLRDRPDSMMNKSIFDRIRTEFTFNQDSLKQQP